MKILVLAALFASSGATAGTDVYRDIHDSVDTSSVWENLRMATGTDPITINGETFKIPERTTDINKKHTREFFMSVMQTIGIPAKELAYSDDGGGTNVEAVLPGKSADSVVLITHYDSHGTPDNPAVDDAASGMAIIMECARVLYQYRNSLEHTVRFVIADHEEDSGSGPYAYATYISQQAQSGSFKVVYSIDFDQSGWISTHNNGHQYDLYVRNQAAIQPMIDIAMDTVKTYEPTMELNIASLGGSMVDSDFLEDAGIPGITPAEKDDAYNPYKDVQGDTFAIISQPYYFTLTKFGVTFVARAVGISP